MLLFYSLHTLTFYQLPIEHRLHHTNVHVSAQSIQLIDILRPLPSVHPKCGLIHQTYLTQSSTLCRKMPKLGAQNCSFLSKIVRKMCYMAFLPPSKTIKGSVNMLKSLQDSILNILPSFKLSEDF